MMTAAEIATFSTGAGIVDRSDRVRLRIAGPDHSKFLHNLTTNEIKRLPPGRGCETFVTSLQGKTIGYLIVLMGDDQIIARADAHGAELVLPHFRKYGVFDDVSIEDNSASTFEIHLLGQGAAALVHRAAGQLPEETDYAHLAAEIAGAGVRIIRESPAGVPGFTLIGELAAAKAIRQELVEHAQEPGLSAIDAETFEVLRIEAGTPVFGKDINDKNLPAGTGPRRSGHQFRQRLLPRPRNRRSHRCPRARQSAHEGTGVCAGSGCSPRPARRSSFRASVWARSHQRFFQTHAARRSAWEWSKPR